MTRKYYSHKLQTNPRHCEEEPREINSNKTSRRQLKQSNLLSFPRQDEIEQKGNKVMHTKTKTNIEHS